MTRPTMRIYSAILLPLLVQGLVFGPVARAQESDDLTFEEEEAMDFSEPMTFEEEAEEGWGEDEWTDDGWGEEEQVVEEVEVAPADDGNVTVTALFVPGDALSAQAADELTAMALTRLQTLSEAGGFTVMGNESLRAEFEIMGGEFALECAFDPVCLGRYGRQLGIDRVVVGRVDQNDLGQWSTTIDLIDAPSSTVANYRVFVSEPAAAAVDAAFDAQLRTLFRIRREVSNDVAEERGPSPAQRAMAWTTLGLGLTSLGVGFVFGSQAASLEDELTECDLVPGFGGQAVCTQSQTSAQVTVDDGKSKAALANVFIGTGLLLSVGSVLLFTVTPGGDIDEDADAEASADDRRRVRNVRLAPALGARTVGFTGGFDF